MDSVTQIALGAAVGEAVLGRRVGRKAAVWGAICGTVPDLDTFVPLQDPVAAFTYHRSYSHSLFMLALLTPLIVWLIRKIHPRDSAHRAGWFALVYAALATHVLLDSFTVYGTQIFWPVVTMPMTWGTVFIIDPLYTLPLIFGVTAVALLRRKPEAGYWLNIAMLMLSTLYLAWSLAAKLHVQNLTDDWLARQQIDHNKVLTMPGPFNTVLWRIIVMTDDGYLAGWYSLLDETRDLELERFDSHPALLRGLEYHWPVARLRWFTKGLFRVTREGNDVYMTDLRMGVEGSYVFRFRVGMVGGYRSYPVPAEQFPVDFEAAQLREMWERLKGRP